jgi:D-erythritol 1-phosphate dehydrogenase
VNSAKRIRLVKGSHIIVRRWWQGDHGYVLQSPDRRLIFINPYFEDLALIGTTEIPFSDKPEDVAISAAETDYLLAIVNRHFRTALTPDDLVWSYSGVRPLFDDDADKGASAVTRDYTFELDGGGNRAPILSAFGGKLTTYRTLSEAALAKLVPHFPQMGRPWTATAPLPGGDMADADFDAFFRAFRARWPWLSEPLARHYARCYGTEADRLLAGARGMDDLGECFGGLFHAREARWLRAEEWAVTAEDMLFRRTKHGVFLSPAERDRVSAWLAAA